MLRNVLLIVAVFLLGRYALAKDLKTIILNDKNSISFNQPFTSNYIAKKEMEILELIRNNSNNEFFIVLYTPGGSVSEGARFIDFLKGTGKKFHTITLLSASMGYQLVQSADKRFILPSGLLMSHRGFASGLSGQIPGELHSRANMLKDMLDSLEIVAAKRVGLSIKDYNESIRDELWLYGRNAVSVNHADEVVNVKCDVSLSRTYTTEIMTMFGPVDLEFSKCPIITAPLSVSSINKEDFNVVNEYFKHPLNFINKRL